MPTFLNKTIGKNLNNDEITIRFNTEEGRKKHKPEDYIDIKGVYDKKQVKLSFTNYQPKKLLKTTTCRIRGSRCRGSNFLKKEKFEKNEKNHKISKKSNIFKNF